MTFSLRSAVIAFGFALSSWVFLLLYFLLQRRNCKRNLNCRVDDAIIAFFHPYWYGATLNATNLHRRIKQFYLLPFLVRVVVAGSEFCGWV
jgi:hypothetical protein